MNPDMEAVFRQRATRLADRRAPSAARKSPEVLVCHAGRERYALELDDLTEVLPFSGCAPIPGAPAGLLGVINLRAELRPVMDLGGLLGASKSSRELSGYIVLVRSCQAGLRVDQVGQILSLPGPVQRTGLPAGYVKAFLPDGLMLLDPAKLLSSFLHKEIQA